MAQRIRSKVMAAALAAFGVLGAGAPAQDAAGAAGTATAEMTPLRGLFPEAAATYAEPNDAVMYFVFWTMTFFFVLLMALMVYFSIKYRRVPGKPQERSANHNYALELTWSGIPLILCFVMFFWGLAVYTDMLVAPGQAERIDVTAKKWAWQFDYPNGAQSIETVAVTEPAEMEIPVFAVPLGRPVRLVMHSEDVIHSFFVPAFRKKIDVFPNRYTTFWFNATKTGNYHLFCAEYCGDQHSQMMGVIRVLDEADYQAWLAKQADTSGIPLLELGQKLYVTKGCNACHSLDGSPGTGPSWQGIYGHSATMTSGETLTVDENYLRESILVPAARIVEGYPNQMPVFQGKLTDRELTALVAFITSLSEDGKSEAERMQQEDDAAREAAQEAQPEASAPPATSSGALAEAAR